MKKAILAIVCAATAMTISAQRASDFATSASETSSYNRISAGYLNENISPKGGDGMGLNGLFVDYVHGFSLTQSIPLYLETGLGIGAGFKSESDEDWEDYSVKNRLMYMNVPLNITYKFAVNPDFSIQPLFGFNFKVNIVGKTKLEIDDPDYEDEEGEINWFDDDDMDGSAFKRFQLGWHIGAGINYKAFYFGLSYGTDFIKIAKKVNTGTFKIGVGFNF